MCVRVSDLLGDSICMGDLVGINSMWATIVSISCGRRFLWATILCGRQLLYRRRDFGERQAISCGRQILYGRRLLVGDNL